MKAYPYVVGRGKYVGYGFSAAAPNTPYNAPWIGGQRASDTLERRPILEMQCAQYGQPVFVASQWVLEGRPFGYTEYLELELPKEEQERRQFLDAPGQMLYLDFMDAKTFLGLDRENGTGHETLAVMDVKLPEIMADKVPQMNREMLAALLADVWANSFQRLLGNEFTPLRLELTAPEQGAQTLDAGRAFLNQVLLPCLPASVRHIISVSIGCFWDSGNRGSASAALVISLPDGHGFGMSGGYHLITGKFQMRGAPAWQEFGQALLDNKDLEYYWKLHKAKEYQPVAADFEVAYLLFRIHRLLSSQPLTDKALSDAFRAWQTLDRVLSQGYPDIEYRERRRLLLPAESGLVRARAKLAQWNLRGKNQYDLLLGKAFTLRGELADSLAKEELSSLLDAYVQAITLPKSMEEWDTYPFARLWLDKEIRDRSLKDDPVLYVSCLERGLKEHASQRPLWNEQLAGLLNVYDVVDTAWKLSVGGILAGYAIRGLENGFPVATVQPVRQTLSVAQPEEARAIDDGVAKQFARQLPGCLGQESALEKLRAYRDELKERDYTQFDYTQLDSKLRTALCAAIRADAGEEAIPLQQFLKACGYFGWLMEPETQDTVLDVLAARGRRGVCQLADDEMQVLQSILQRKNEYASGKVIKALDPMASLAAGNDAFIARLGVLLPALWSYPPEAAPRDGWGAAYRQLVLTAMKGVMGKALVQSRVLLQPGDVWKECCPFSWLTIGSLDELTLWHMEEDELRGQVQETLTRALGDYALPDLQNTIQPARLGEGWFSRLVKDGMAALLLSGKLETLLHQCDGYEDMRGLKSLCDVFLKQEDRRDLRDALAFAVERPAQDDMQQLGIFRGLSRRDVAGALVGELIRESGPCPWDVSRWNDRALMGFVSALGGGTEADASIKDFLRTMQVEPDSLDKADPWDGGEGTKALEALLFAFHWLERMGLPVFAQGLAEELMAYRRFTRLVRRGRDAKSVFAPVHADKVGGDAMAYSGALRQWLFGK